MADPRIDPNRYGPQSPQGPLAQSPVPSGIPASVGMGQGFSPVADVSAPMREALTNVDPEMAYLVDSIGSSISKRGGADLLMNQALQKGDTTQTLHNQVAAADSAEAAMKMAEDSMHLSNDQFNEILGKLQSETDQTPNVPVMAEPKQPNRLAQGLAAVLAIGTPSHAFEIASVPYQEEQRKVAQQYQHDVAVYGQEMAKRGERLNLLHLRLGIAEDRRKEASATIQRLAAEAYQRGERARGQALEARSKIYDSASEAELNDRLSTMRENFPPEYLPDQKTIDGIRANIKSQVAAAAQKAQLETEKEERARQFGLRDDFVAWVNSNYPAGVSLSPEDVQKIETQRRAFAKDNKVPLSVFPQYSTRTAPASENAALAEKRYNEITVPMLKISQEHLQIAKDREQRLLNQELGKPTKEQANKAKRIAALDTKIQSAKIDLDALMNQGPPDDPDDREKWTKNVSEAWAKELAIVQMKRTAAGGKAPAPAEYFNERFPGVAKSFIGNLVGGIGGKLSTGGTSANSPPLTFDPATRSLGSGGEKNPPTKTKGGNDAERQAALTALKKYKDPAQQAAIRRAYKQKTGKDL